MVARAPIPPDETARVAALRSYEILDTPPEDRFDLFTRLGTWLYGVPISAINLVDADRTFFKSLIGFGAYEPQRCTSICAHAVGSSEPMMVIEDLAQDPRFHDHPLVTTKGVRFYAAAVLRTEAGHALGTLCIADVKPRVLTGDERQKLAELAMGVSSVLELHRNGVRLLRAATRDTLTGLFNRRLFEEELDKAIERARSGVPCALLFLDLDRFKQINDTFGHAVGDEILCEVARRLGATARPPNIVARLAGDEFVILMPELASPERAEQMASRVLGAFAESFHVQGVSLPIRNSIGIALSPDHALHAAGLLRCADLAMYDAKRSGRSRYSLHQARDKPVLEVAL